MENLYHEKGYMNTYPTYFIDGVMHIVIRGRIDNDFGISIYDYDIPRMIEWGWKILTDKELEEFNSRKIKQDALDFLTNG